MSVLRPASSLLLDHFRRRHIDRQGREINLTLRPAYLDLLRRLGNPQEKLPPAFHVAGTNGKGSTCAFLRALLEAAGYRVHVYTSPHLVRMNERIRLAGRLIAEEELAEILRRIDGLSPPGAISPFEALTAAAFAAFAGHPADFAIIEVGLGGRLDATNVISAPLASLITRLSYDHRDYLGDTLTEIAAEKAGIMKPGIPCFAAPQPNADALTVLHDTAKRMDAPFFVGGADWQVETTVSGWRYRDAERDMDLLLPVLAGRHQLDNAALAIRALGVLPRPLPQAAIANGLGRVDWPARLQPLRSGALAALLPQAWELWLDGGHNDSAGEALAAQARLWAADGKPLHLILGMLCSKAPQEFLQPLRNHVASLRCVGIDSNDPMPVAPYAPAALAALAREAGFKNVEASETIAAAIADCVAENAGGGRILICGSLYLAGQALELNGNLPA